MTDAGTPSLSLPAVNLPAFNNEQLWQQAMTHSSFSNEHPESGEHNERLEFLGDAILNFISGAYLYERYPDRPEGELSAIRAALVDRPQLCHFAQLLNLGAHLRLGKGASQSGSRQSARLLCSAFEAMIGAYFLDVGKQIQPVSDYVTPLFDQVVETAVSHGIKDDKTTLQEQIQKSLGVSPEYVEVGRYGPDHAAEFVVAVRIQGKTYGTGRGSSKQKAQKAAAKKTLQMLP